MDGFGTGFTAGDAILDVMVGLKCIFLKKTELEGISVGFVDG